MTDTTTTTPAQQLAALIGDTAARNTIQAGWDAIRDLNKDRLTVDPGAADYVATLVILAAAPHLTAINAADHAEEKP